MASIPFLVMSLWGFMYNPIRVWKKSKWSYLSKMRQPPTFILSIKRESFQVLLKGPHSFPKMTRYQFIGDHNIPQAIFLIHLFTQVIEHFFKKICKHLSGLFKEMFNKFNSLMAIIIT